ncbi:MAG: alpha/beta fold hydrolase [Sphingomonadales bacterium]|nr:alpha/beta fold hydrolase [Sphingomonadales bacterium]
MRPSRFLPSLPLLLTLGACAPPPPEVTLSTQGPTVIFEAGLGDTAEAWTAVQLPPDLGRFAWTRAGYGLGPALLVGRDWPGDRDGRRSGAEVAAQLEQALQQSGVAPPYILVGHSLGALYVLHFAKTHPEQIAGIVLVDPRLPGFTTACKARGLRGCEVPPLLRLALSDTEQLELAGVPETEAALSDLHELREIPLTLLLATRGGLGEDPGWRQLWAEHAETFARGFTTARVVPVDSGHYIQSADPALVVDEITRLVR